MATKSKDSIGGNNTPGRREKVALTSSNSKPKSKPTTLTRTSSSSLKPSSSDKPIPNYLKHTKSSLHDSGPTPKPALVRRRSFDNKSPRTQTKPISERLAQQPTRSSSFSRAPRSSVGPTPRLVYTKAPKKGSGEAFVRKEAPSAAIYNDLVAVKAKEEDQHDNHVQHDDITTVSEELVVVVVKSDHGDHDSDVGVEEDHHHENKSEDQESHDHGDEIGKETVSIVGSEDAISVAEESVKEDDKAVNSEEINNDHDVTDGNFGNESDANAVKESLGEENGNAYDNERVVDISVVVDVEENKKDKELGGELGKKSEEEGKKGISGSSASSSSSSSSSENKKNGKKEAQVAYNDVIEETASKLLEKRKNKVKALVGAFETVIDYETAANNK